MSFLDDRSKQDFLVYANSVIKARAIPSVEDNLKPIHRKILWTMYEDKLYPEKKTTKCASVVGDALHYSPHGDASVYGALVRLSQWWKLRYPLITMQGNCGNILGDGAAASRYTECKLSPVGMLMLDDLNKNCVEMKPNYSGEQMEPSVLPSRFPWLLCGNNSGIAVGMSSDLVSHNYTEVAAAISHYIDHNDCSIADLMQFIKGPDFPTGGMILNGEELESIYTSGHGAVKVAAHYDISKKGHKTLLTFHDVPYGVEIDSGIKTPLKKLVLDDGYEVFEDINVEKAGPRNFDIKITLAKDADVAKCLEILFTKTRLSDSIKINNTVIINGEPRLLNLKQMIEYWVNYRHNIIIRIARNDYAKTNHKLTVTLGLQKCMSDIDKLVSIVRNADNRAAAKSGLMAAFALNDEQAEAVLEMKLSKLSRLDITELNKDAEELEKTLAKIKSILDEKSVRDQMIKDDLAAMKKVIGEDRRLTEIHYAKPVINSAKPQIKQEFKIYKDGIHQLTNDSVEPGLITVVQAYGVGEIYGFTADGRMGPITVFHDDLVGAFVKNDGTKLVAVTAMGNIKVSSAEEYKWTKSGERVLKVKDGDSLVFVGCASDNNCVILYGGADYVLKLAVKDLALATKLTVGVKSGYANIISAALVTEGDMLLFWTKENKAKITCVKDFNIDARGNKGQLVAKDTAGFVLFTDRESIYATPKSGAPFSIDHTKVSVKGKTAIGASLSTRNLIAIR